MIRSSGIAHHHRRTHAMNSFAAIASLLAASAFAGTVSADSQRHADKAPSAQIKTDKAAERK
jgi:hypothetical protein